MKTKVLITGGSGFIGSHLRKKLREIGFQVLTIGRNKQEDIVINLLDPKLKNILEEYLPEIVFHLAGTSSVSKAEENKNKDLEDTLGATKHLIKNLLDLTPEKFIYVSSQAVYGVPEYLPVDEKHLTKPTTTYGASKLKAEAQVQKSSLNYLIFRVSGVFGLNQDYNKSGVIAKFINKLKNNQPPVVFNSIDLFSDLIYIDDLVDALVKAVDSNTADREVFNLGTGRPTSLKEVLDILYGYFPLAPKPKVEFNPLYLNKEQKGLYLDIKKIKTMLNWEWKYDVKKGLEKMLAMTNIQLPQTL